MTVGRTLLAMRFGLSETSKVANSVPVDPSMASLVDAPSTCLRTAATEDHQAADKDAYRQPNKQDGGPAGKHS